MIRPLPLFLSLLLGLVWPMLACAATPLIVADIIRTADEITLFSIQPQQIHEVDEHGDPTEAERKKERFHGYAVFGKIRALDGTTQQAVRDALLAALGRVKEEAPSQCFLPRHAVCLKRGAQHVDLLICFECGNAELRHSETLADGEIVRRKQIIGLGTAGQQALNRMLDARGIARDIPERATRR